VRAGSRRPAGPLPEAPALADWQERHSSIDELAGRFPARPIQQTWAATETSPEQARRRLLASLLLQDLPYATYRTRVVGQVKVLDWLQAQPGQTWQARWLASGAEDEPGADWRALVAGVHVEDPHRAYADLGPGLRALICADLVRPSIGWLLATRTRPRKLPASLALTRDPDGFARLAVLCAQAAVSIGTTGPALDRIAIIMAANGGTVADIRVGDCLQILRISTDIFTDGHYNSPFFYQLLHAMGIFGPTAPPTIRVFITGGQRSPEQLIDRYDIASRPIRDLLVDYLRERQPRLDYSTLEGLSRTLGNLFWADLERHHPGIATLQLPSDVAAAWKQRLFTKTTNTAASATGQVREACSPRISAMQILATVRALLPRPGRVGGRRTGPLGPVGGPQPGPCRRHLPQERPHPAQVTDGSTNPGTHPGATRPDRRPRRRTPSRRRPARNRNTDPTG